MCVGRKQRAFPERSSSPAADPPRRQGAWTCRPPGTTVRLTKIVLTGRSHGTRALLSTWSVAPMTDPAPPTTRRKCGNEKADRPSTAPSAAPNTSASRHARLTATRERQPAAPPERCAHTPKRPSRVTRRSAPAPSDRQLRLEGHRPVSPKPIALSQIRLATRARRLIHTHPAPALVSFVPDLACPFRTTGVRNTPRRP